jgi:AcrR family transcriptional regulator
MATKMAAKKSAKKASEHGGVAPIENVRDRILATARDLIYREGARAVGVDRIVAESGVAKMSLYRWFPSKDDLIVAVLQEEQRRILQAWDQNMERHKGSPLKQLRAQFESLVKAISQPAYRGCPFLNAVTAFADETHPARTVARAFKDEITNRFHGLAVAIGAKHPDVLAAQLSLVADGAHACGQAVGKEGPALAVESMVDALIAAQLPAKR